MPFPAPKTQLKIFNAEPPACADTWAASVKGLSTQNEQVAVTLFSPNLRLIGSLDNTESGASCSYQVSVTTGFTFSSTQSVSITDEVGVDIEVVSAKTSITFSLSFTEEWSTSRTTTMAFDCPAGQKAFLYQGTLMSKVLHFDPSSAQYSWKGDAAKALTQVLVTSSTSFGATPFSSMQVVGS